VAYDIDGRPRTSQPGRLFLLSEAAGDLADLAVPGDHRHRGTAAGSARLAVERDDLADAAAPDQLLAIATARVGL
jgi:hypothetical protein